MPPARPVLIANRHPRLRLNRRGLLAVIAALDTHFRILPGDRPHLTRPRKNSAFRLPPSAFPVAVPAGELSLVLLTNPALAQLHADFLGDPTPTDVITFEGDATLGSAGEICVSADTAATYAKKHRRDFNAELTLYVVHGWLHLAGYDDLQPARKRVMRRAEARAMKLLTAAKLGPVFSWRS